MDMNSTFNETRTITSPDELHRIFDLYFTDKSAYLDQYGKKIRVKCYNCNNGKAMVGIPYVKKLTDQVVVFTNTGENLINLQLKKITRHERNIYLFEIVRCNIIVPSRCSSRYRISSGSEPRKSVFITDIINEDGIGNSLLNESRKVSSILNYLENELKRHFSSVRFMAKTDEVHQTCQYNSSEGKAALHENGYEYYMKYIFEKEFMAQNSSLMFKEAVLPLYYRGKIPYGWLMVGKDCNLTDTDLGVAGSFIQSVERYLLKLGVFQTDSERIAVSEVSLSGLSVVQGEKNMRRFPVGNRFCCDLVLPENQRVNLLVKVRHNFSDEEGIVHTGLEIEKTDAEKFAEFKQFLDSYENHH